MNKEVHWGWVVAAIVVAILILVGGLWWQDRKRTAEYIKYRQEVVAGEQRIGSPAGAISREER
ncbi:MAG: hypothetical protein KatS3mg022_0886 [Armatimonadota bacterium]|nr:MAG: hypothetical protein KatS3mg022_0886 [Armatimonadota bacterium]